jgi:hypothetical protein
MLGVYLFAGFAYVLGRYPNDFFYKFYVCLVPIMVFIRWIEYKPKGWHYFLVDFCYYGGAVVLLFVSLYPKSKLMYRLAFLYANGALAVATAAFSNALIFHKLQNLICLTTHPVPLVCMWNIRQVTQYYERDLPEEKRTFA